MGLQQFCGDRHVCGMRRGQRDVADDPTERDEQMEFEAKDRLFLGGALAQSGPLCCPFGTRVGRVVQLDDREWQAIDNTVGVLRYV